MTNSRNYQAQDGRTLQVIFDEDIREFNLEQLISDGLYIHGTSKVGNSFDWLEDLTEEEQKAIYEINERGSVQEAIEQWQEENETEEIPDIAELVDTVNLDNLVMVISNMSHKEFSKVVDILTSVHAFGVQGYTQGESELVVLPADIFEDEDASQDYVSAVLYDGFYSVVEIDEDGETVDVLTALSARDYSTDDPYTDTLDTHMEQEYKATPIN